MTDCAIDELIGAEAALGEVCGQGFATFAHGRKAQKPCKAKPSRNVLVRLAFLFGELLLGPAAAVSAFTTAVVFSGKVSFEI
jgi:hypothetical protein